MLLVAACFLALPLATVSLWLHQNQRWAPVFDYALIEMRVRDVGTAHTPLLGLPGRLGSFEAMGSHPGPLGFYLLAPLYRLFGGSYWALRVSTCAFNTLAIVLTLAIAKRRAGKDGVIAAGVLLALLELGYGLLILTEPWNPHLPVLWFVVFLVSIWSVLCGDFPMLLVAAGAACTCAQTHIPYLAVCGLLGLFAFVFVVVSWLRTPNDPARRRTATVLIATAALTLLLWSPPLLQQYLNTPGNITRLYNHLTNPPEPLVGLRAAAAELLTHLDLWHLVAHPMVEPFALETTWTHHQPSVGRGGVCFVVWLATAFLALRLKNRLLLALHGAVLAAVLVGLFAISRIIGPPWNYLTLWAWAVGAAMLLATVSTVAFGIRSRVPRLPAPQLFRFVGIALIMAWPIRLATEVRRAGSRTPGSTAALAKVIPGTAAALMGGRGYEGRYLITWDDAYYGGGQGYGMVNELERLGFRVGVEETYAALVAPHRTMKVTRATTRIHVAIGAGPIRRWRKARAKEIAYADPRTPAELAEYRNLRSFAVQTLREAGRSDLAARFDQNLAVPNVSGANPFFALAVGRMTDMGAPVAVFMMKPGSVRTRR